MPSRRPALILAALSLTAAPIVAAPANSEEYHCRRNDLVRRIEVEFAADADRLPCQVVYWADTERPGEKRIPWNAKNQVEFCTGKARDMVERLQSTGWTCERESPPAEDAAALDEAGPPKEAFPEPAASDDEPAQLQTMSPPLQTKRNPPRTPRLASPSPTTLFCRKRWPGTSVGSMS